MGVQILTGCCNAPININDNREYCSICNRDLTVQRKEQKVDRFIYNMEMLMNEAIKKGDSALANALLVNLINLKEKKLKHEERLIQQKYNESIIQTPE